MRRLAYALAGTGTLIGLMFAGLILYLALTTTQAPGKSFADENFGFFAAMFTTIGGSYGGAVAILTSVSDDKKHG